MLRTPPLNIIGSSRVNTLLGLALRLAFASSLSSFYKNSYDASIRISSVYMPTIPKVSLIVVISRHRS
jgi:hypothetical protein